MTRTFSLRLLLLAVTAVCVGLGIVINFPNLAFGFGWRLGFSAPAIIVCLLLSRVSSRSRTTIVCGLLGALIAGFIFMPVITRNSRGPETYWEFFVTYYLILAIPPAVGALLFCGVEVLMYRWWRKTADMGVPGSKGGPLTP